MRDKKNDAARLELMRDAIANIEEFLTGASTCDEFANNKILCHAVVYNLQCIGENVYRLSEEFVCKHKDVDWKSIEGLRHILVHDYYNVNLELVWEMLIKDLPELKTFLDSVVDTSQKL